MEKRIGHRTMGKLMAAAAVGLAGVGAASQADAALVVDIRATALNGGPLTLRDSSSTAKDVKVAVGDVVTLQIWAQASGTNGANDEVIKTLQGSLVSTGILKGGLAGGVSEPFTTPGYQNGASQDLDLDGDLDLGAQQNAGVATDYIAPFQTVAQGGTATDANTEEIQVYQATFTVTAGTGSDSTLVRWLRRQSISGGNVITGANWSEDGQIKSATTSQYTAGAPVEIGIPEPSGLALAGLAGLGFLARRRNGDR
jgi:MYXO-CTERM domain-containing protein